MTFKYFCFTSPNLNISASIVLTCEDPEKKQSIMQKLTEAVASDYLIYNMSSKLLRIVILAMIIAKYNNICSSLYYFNHLLITKF